MFDEGVTGRHPDPEAFARFDARMTEALDRRATLITTTAQSAGWVARIGAAARLANAAQAAQLAAIGELFAYRFTQHPETMEWVIDTEAAVAAEVAAELKISPRLAASRIRYARQMRERLPKVGAVFAAGEIDYRAFQTIVCRTELITDPDVLARVDELIACNVVRWPSMTNGRLSGKVDAIVARADADAVPRREKTRTDREVWIGGDQDGVSQIQGSLLSPDAHALDQRLSALAATVCPHDPRTATQRRADALGALAAGADRLGCRCGRAECDGWAKPAASPVTIHVIAEQTTLTGTGTTPAWEVGADGLITPELLAELAASATLMPLLHPGDAPPEPHYRPSPALAAFVRARDLTCRAPGCDVPAAHCQLDHTIPYAQGGPTHAGNLSCKCPTHHLLKTFWGWRDQQLPDGTLIWTLPSGQTHVTTPGSALLFPSLCHAVGGIPAPETDPPPPAPSEQRAAMMPKRRRTRTQDRAYRIATERTHNQQAREARHAAEAAARATRSNKPPPF